jgi:hypothetical protein
LWQDHKTGYFSVPKTSVLERKLLTIKNISKYSKV